MLLPIPWPATDLPGPVPAEEEAAAGQEAPLLSPAALLALVRFLRHRPARPA
jgi:hypothetical protein